MPVLDGMINWQLEAPFALKAWKAYLTFGNLTDDRFSEAERYKQYVLSSAEAQGDYQLNVAFSIFIPFAIAQGLQFFPFHKIAALFGAGTRTQLNAERGKHGLIFLSYLAAAIVGQVFIWNPLSDKSRGANNFAILNWMTIALIAFILALSYVVYLTPERSGAEVSSGAQLTLITTMHASYVFIGVLILMLPQDSDFNADLQVWAGALYIFAGMGVLARKDPFEKQTGWAIFVQILQAAAFFAGSVLMLVRNFKTVLNVSFLLDDASNSPWFIFLAILWFFIAIGGITLLVRFFILIARAIAGLAGTTATSSKSGRGVSKRASSGDHY
jgi:hypothetical protein